MNQVGLLLPTGEIEVVATAMVRKGKPVQVHLRHDQAGNAGKDKQASAAESHQALINDIFSEDSGTASSGMRAHMTESFIQALKAF